MEAIGRSTETPDGPTIILQKASIANVVPLQGKRKHASRIATAARNIITNSYTPAPLKLPAIMILVHATFAEQTLATTSLGLFIAQLKMQPADELKTKVSKRLRHGIRAILTKLGLRGEAALLIALKEQPPRAVTELTRLDIEAWSTTAMAKLAKMPLSPQEWLAVLKDADHTTGVKKYNAEKGFAIWRPYAPAWAEPPREPRSFVTWNANCLFKRIRNGDFARMLNDHAADLIHITEVKGTPGNDMAASELRQVLFALGYIHIVWNWCTKTPFNHGSAVFSKVPIDKVEFGIEGTGEDNEDRTITTHFPGSAQVWTYTPCSSMYVTDVEERRRGYNTAFKRHVQRTQRDRGN